MHVNNFLGHRSSDKLKKNNNNKWTKLKKNDNDNIKKVFFIE